jgi:glutathione synthase/RimK-type ligase-like ATP-grasp enzyme
MLVAVYKLAGIKDDFERDIYQEILNYNGIDTIEFTYKDEHLLEKLKSADYIIMKWGHSHNELQFASTYLPILEKQMHKKIFPNFETCWHYDDKVKQDILLKQAGFPFVESWLFYDRERALDWADSADYPVVFKLTRGAGSFGVLLVSDSNQAKSLIKRMFSGGVRQDALKLSELPKLVNNDLSKLIKYIKKAFFDGYLRKDSLPYWSIHKNYAYFQKFCPNNSFDTRVTTAGQRAHAFRRFVRKNDFRASGGNRWDITPANIDLNLVRIALDISRYFGFQSMAYDFVYDEKGNPRIVEMSYMYGGAGYPDFMNGYWDADLNWHEGRFWPQFFELADLIIERELKCPEIKVRTGYSKAEIMDGG